MGALQVLIVVTSAVLVIENGFLVDGAPSGTYSYTTVHKSSSSNNAITAKAATRTQATAAVAPAGTHGRSQFSSNDYRRYMPVEDTPEVKKAREQFFKLYQKQASLAAQAKDHDLDGTFTQTTHMRSGTDNALAEDEDYDYYYYDDYENEEYDSEEGEEEEEEEDEEESEEEDEEEEEEDDDDDDEDEEDSDEEEDSSEEGEDSSSSEEDEYGDSSSSSEEDGEDSSEEDGEDSSSSSSSSSSEEDDGTVYSWQSKTYQPLNTNSLRPVTDTPEVKLAKRKFFDLYKTQAELSFNAPDDH